MELEDFDYQLPDSLIATRPLPGRDHSRLLHYQRESGALTHRHFFDLPDCLRPGDTLVLNNTKVLPARLRAVDDQGHEFEILLLKPVSPDFLVWQCLVRPGKRVGDSLDVSLSAGAFARLSRDPQAEGVFRFELTLPQGVLFEPWIFGAGEPPLPPYLKREAEPQDLDDYQTVYARTLGSVAAPTAGLHFTESLLNRLREREIFIEELTLHVGYGTFSPVRAPLIEDHVMHSESYEIAPATYERIQDRRRAGGRLIAVGTTSLRALESVPRTGLKGETRLFITPGYAFQAVDGLITNFHLPKSSLYILVCALLGLEPARKCYAEAVKENYRFFSYGDAMAIL